MRPLIPPCILFDGVEWPERELIARALHWRAAAVAAPSAPLTALAMANHPDAVALLAALTAGVAPVVLLPPEPAAWLTAPPIPPGTPLFLIPSLAELAPAAERSGLRPVVVSEPRRHTGHPGAAPLRLRAPGLVSFTSGSAGAPRPVYRAMAAVLTQGRILGEVFDLPGGAPLLGMVPLARNHGLSRSLVPAALLGSPLGLLRAFDHRSALAALASTEYCYAAGTPLLADVLGRCTLPGPAPRMSRVFEVGGGALPAGVSRAFAARFRVSARPAYGSSELGTVTTDTAQPDAIRPGTVGRPLPGVEIRIGDDPASPGPAGVLGPIWARTPWQMAGYGYPPDVKPGSTAGGWTATGDVGVQDAAGYLTLLGRSDECFKTAAGHLVRPTAIVDALARHPEMRDAIVVPVSTGRGLLVGALVEGDPRLDPKEVRRHAAGMLPWWWCPHVVVVSPELPRGPGGKLDRHVARRRLEDAMAPGRR